MTKKELQLWKKYTTECERHNKKFSEAVSKRYQERMKKEEKEEEAEKKKFKEEWESWSQLSTWKKLFVEEPTMPYTRWNTFRITSLEMNRLYDKIMVSKEMGGEKEITYENFLTWLLKSNTH